MICWLSFHLQSWIVLLWNHISISQLDISTWMPNWHLKLTHHCQDKTLDSTSPQIHSSPTKLSHASNGCSTPTTQTYSLHSSLASHFNTIHQQDILTVLSNMFCFHCYNPVSPACLFCPLQSVLHTASWTVFLMGKPNYVTSFMTSHWDQNKIQALSQGLQGPTYVSSFCFSLWPPLLALPPHSQSCSPLQTFPRSAYMASFSQFTAQV